MKKWMLMMATAVCFAIASASAQENGHVPVSVVHDWSTRHVIFAEDVTRENRGSVLAEPRFWQQYLRRHAPRPESSFRDHDRKDENGRDRDGDDDRDEHHRKRHQAASKRDWSFSLGGGSGGRISGPAKFVFDVTAAPSCTADFVVTGISVAGAAGQANIIGLNNLYTNPAGTGSCAGTAPTVMFAYNVGGGQVPSIVALSLNGQKVAFTENNPTSTSNFHVLTFKTGTGNGTSATAPAVPGTGNTAVDVKLALSGASVTGPFVDYAHDAAYVTSGTVVHKFSGVFNGTPAEVTGGGWPATITGAAGVSTPVYDNVSRHIFVTDTDGFIDYIDDSVSPAVVHPQTFSFSTGGGTAAPVVVDSSRQKVYAFQDGNNAVVAQADTSLTNGSRVIVNVGGSSANAILEGDFNNAYYSGGASTSSFLYVVGSNNAGNRPSLYNIGFTSAFQLNATTANGPLALSTANASASPITEFFNSRLARDFIFVGISASCQFVSGCIRSIDITSGFPTAATVNNVILNAAGGTGTITVDNNSGSAEASSVYYTTQTGATLIKATQAALQ